MTGVDRDTLRLLVLAPFAPRLDAVHGGGKVLAQFLSRMCTRHHMALLYLRAVDEPPIDTFILENCEWVEEVPRVWSSNTPLRKLVRMAHLLACLFSQKPMWVGDWESRAYAERLRSLVAQWQPEIVQIETHVMAQYLRDLRDCPARRVLTEAEPGILAAPYLKSGPALVRRIGHKFDQAAWAHFEPAAIQQVQTVVTFSKKDQDSLAHFGLPVAITNIPFGTNLPDHPLDPLGRSPISLLFVGNFLHPPNIEAALRLIKDIFPVLHKKFPELKLTIAGPHPPQELKQLSSEPAAVTGFVQDLIPILDHAAVFVAPLCSGGGVRVKILEALSYGKAIVATPLAVEGLDLKDGEQVLLGESDAEIIAQVSLLLTNPEQRAALARRARAWACENLGWDEPIAEWEKLYSTLLSGQV